ncbi:hypothetical protein [Nonomuraea sp. SBT364]|uniref:hypothetical protein n=1 Tax=Nonomuraea sp. SBT364 TaxID=1580530 RepID=UPI0012E275EC|nr:hypothetical protein [Nonomuraea sp. SBT364]
MRVLEWAGWSTAIGITVGTLTIDLVGDYPWFFSRAFGLAALSGAVLTLVRWLDNISKPVQLALALGIRTGVKVGQFQERLAQAERWNDPYEAVARRIMDSEGRRDTPPASWRN